MVKTATIYAAVCVLAASLACAVSTPLTPAPPATNAPATAPDGSTLKASAPKQVSPVNNDVVPNEQPTLVITGATGDFANRPFFYEFQLTTDAGDLVRADTIDGLQWALPLTLAFDTPYRWRARAVLQGANGPWSGTARFFTPRPPQLNKPTRQSSPEDWRKWFEDVRNLRGIGPTVSNAALAATRADLLAVEADWQNGWRGDLRARIFIPVPNCNPTAANNPSPPACAFGRTVDVGNIGETWKWIVRDWQ
jgi:hypothetical protein